MNARAQRSAFTLIELLVVVAIIALLISILLPALGRAQATARMIRCEAVLKNLGAALSMYADQDGTYYPPVWTDGSNTQPHPVKDLAWNKNFYLRKALQLDTSSKFDEGEGYYCPDSPPIAHTQNNWSWQYGMNNIGLVYGMRNNYSGGGKLNAVAVPRNKLRNLSAKVQMCDATNFAAPAVWGAVNPDDRWAKGGDVPSDLGGQYTAAFRHMNKSGLNALFFDTHVGFMNLKDAYPAPISNTTLPQLAEIWWANPDMKPATTP